MKKTIFSVILMTFVLVLGSCNGKGNATVEAQNDSTAVDSTAIVDSAAVVSADSIQIDSVKIAE